MPENKDKEPSRLMPTSDNPLERRNSTGNRRKQVVSENVVKRMSMKPAESYADFTVHITEAGEEVRTTSRIIKGALMQFFSIKWPY